MATTMRLSAELVAAAEREAMIQKRSVPKQIEFWATLGKALQDVVDYADIIAIRQGLKRIVVEPVESRSVETDAVFEELKRRRERGSLGGEVSKATFYFEASQRVEGMIDRVDASTGERQTGRFLNGVFHVLR